MSVLVPGSRTFHSDSILLHFPAHTSPPLGEIQCIEDFDEPSNPSTCQSQPILILNYSTLYYYYYVSYTRVPDITVKTIKARERGKRPGS